MRKKNKMHGNGMLSCAAMFKYLLRPLLQGTKQSANPATTLSAGGHSPRKLITHHSQLTTLLSSIIHYSSVIITILLLSSCEKIITPRLDEDTKKIVIEGTISYPGGLPEVRISGTKSFTDNNSIEGIDGALVTIQVNNGKVYTLNNPGQGIYNQLDFTGQLDNTYTLTVKLNGNTYTAVSHLPAQIVRLDSLWAEALIFGGTNNITIFPQYNDPKGLGNYYRLVEYANDTLVRKAFPQNDEFSNGRTVTQPLLNPDSKLKEGDNITVYLQCTDAAVYKYWFSLDQAATGNNQSATPTNPVTNISGGALGYFSAYSETSYSFTIP